MASCSSVQAVAARRDSSCRVVKLARSFSEARRSEVQTRRREFYSRRLFRPSRSRPIELRPSSFCSAPILETFCRSSSSFAKLEQQSKGGALKFSKLVAKVATHKTQFSSSLSLLDRDSPSSCAPNILLMNSERAISSAPRSASTEEAAKRHPTDGGGGGPIYRSRARVSLGAECQLGARRKIMNSARPPVSGS